MGTEHEIDEEDPGLSEDEIIAQAQLLKDSNDARVAKLEEAAGGTSLENAFDALKMIVLLEHVAIACGVRANAELDFQGRKEVMLGGIETKYAEMVAARDAAQRQSRLATIHGSSGPVGRRGPG